MKVYGQLEQATLEVVSSDPAGTVQARVWFNSTSGLPKVHNGSAVKEFYIKDAADVVVLTTATQALTNKDVDGGTAANNRRITIPKGTTAAITALTRKEGTILYSTDAQLLYFDNGTSLIALATPVVPALNYQLSASSGNFSTSSTSYVDVSNLSVTITTLNGRPVFVGLTSAANGNIGQVGINAAADTAQGNMKFLRDATETASFKFGSIATAVVDPIVVLSWRTSASSFSHFDPVAAGTYTYKVQVQVQTGTDLEMAHIRLVAYEL